MLRLVTNVSSGTLVFPDGTPANRGQSVPVEWPIEWDDHPVLVAWVSEGMIILSNALPNQAIESPIEEPKPVPRGRLGR